MVSQWLLGPEGWFMPVCEIDLRVGGRYRYLWRHRSEPREFGVSGVFHEIAAPHRLVSTEQFDGPMNQGEAVNTMVLTAQAGITRLTLTMRYPSKEIRDGALQSGMNEGIEISFARLEGQLTTADAREGKRP